MTEISQGYFYDKNSQRVNIDFSDAVARQTLATQANDITAIKADIETMKNEPLTYAEQLLREDYPGRNLLEVFEAEIDDYANVWEWLADRVSLHSYTGLLPFDYVPETIGSDEIPMILGGFDLDAECTDTEQAPGLFFHMGKVVGQGTQWNTTNTNQGNATNAAPYMVSNIKTYLDGTLLPLFPSTMRAHMGNRRNLLETRYTAGSTLTDSTNWAWNDLGRLWLLSEIEVYGHLQMAGPRTGAADTQWPIFKRTKDRIRRDVDGTRRSWWLLSVMAGSSTYCCNVYGTGNANHGNASNSGVAVAAGFKVVGE